VREWQVSLQCSSMFGDWKVKVINEADTMTAPAQDLMLSVLDELPTKRAIICTSNLSVKDLSERFRTRFQLHKVGAPTQEEIANLLCEHGLPPDQAAFISVASGGNVRAAMNDAEAWFMETKHAARAHQQDLSAVLLGL
jgi:DNA polymerase III delta prime subunit